MDIYIGNLNLELEEDSLSKLFEVFGSTESITIVRDMETKESRGFGFVKMYNAIEAQRAINELHDIDLAGRRLIVNEAKPKSEKIEIKQQPLKIHFEQNPREKHPAVDEEPFSFKIPRESENPIEYSKAISSDGFVKIKFSS